LPPTHHRPSGNSASRKTSGRPSSLLFPFALDCPALDCPALDCSELDCSALDCSDVDLAPGWGWSLPAGQIGLAPLPASVARFDLRNKSHRAKSTRAVGL